MMQATPFKSRLLACCYHQEFLWATFMCTYPIMAFIWSERSREVITNDLWWSHWNTSFEFNWIREGFKKFQSCITNSIYLSCRISLPLQVQTYISVTYNLGWNDSSTRILNVKLRGNEAHHAARRDNSSFEIHWWKVDPSFQIKKLNCYRQWIVSCTGFCQFI